MLQVHEGDVLLVVDGVSVRGMDVPTLTNYILGKYADVCWRMLMYADLCGMDVPTPTNYILGKYADVCWHMLTYGCADALQR
jgi:hypothetical protein